MMIRERDGFTAVELMITLVVFGIVAVMSVPAFSQFMQSWKLSSEIDQIAGLMRRARSAAVTKNTITIFKFKMSSGTYFYFEDDNENGTRDAGEYQSSVRELPPGITFDAHTLSGPILVFSPRGNANEGGAITIKNSRQNTRRVTVFSGTGNIKSS